MMKSSSRVVARKEKKKVTSIRISYYCSVCVRIRKIKFAQYPCSCLLLVSLALSLARALSLALSLLLLLALSRPLSLCECVRGSRWKKGGKQLV